MLGSHNVNIFDRIKETSYTIGTGNFVLNGAANGFSAFSSVYASGDNVFYAATDGTYYEVGSGVYIPGVQNNLIRFPIKSTNSNNKVSFGEGIKEIFVTYPATHSIYMASGLGDILTPKSSGLAFWLSSNIIGYDNALVWDSANNRLGINTTLPGYGIDVGGVGNGSFIRASGFIPGTSGIIFTSGINGDLGYAGGIQKTHYEANSLNTLSGSDEVLELSGIAKNHILLKKQNAGLVFAGPASGCTPPCSPDYPSFRPLLVEDIHDLKASVINNGDGLSLYQNLGINTSRLDGQVTAYTNQISPNVPSGILKAAYVASGLYGGGLTLVDTVNQTNPFAQYGYGIFTTESGVNLNLHTFNMASGIVQEVLTLRANGSPTTSTMDFFGQKLRIRNSKTPASASASGNTGDICWDTSYLYVCVSTNTWKRAALSTWP